MLRPVRHSSRLWGQHKETILSHYANHCLQEVMDYMKQEHHFEASKMAFKKKLSRWNGSGKRSRRVIESQAEGDHIHAERPATSHTDTTRSPLYEDPAAGQDLHFSPCTVPESLSRHASGLNNVAEEDPISGVENRNSLKLAKQTFLDILDFSLQSRLKLKDGMIENDEDEDVRAEEVLEEFSSRYWSGADLATMERILSAYHTFLGPQNLDYLLRSKRYCENAAKLSNLSSTIAERFYKSTCDLREGKYQFTLLESELGDGIFTALSLRHQGFLEQDKFKTVMHTLEGMNYLQLSMRGDRQKNIQLYTIKSYVKLIAGERTSMWEDELQDLSSTIDQLFESILQHSSSSYAGKRDFIHDCMIHLHELWNWQCDMSVNWLWSRRLVGIVHNLHAHFSTWDFQLSAFYLGICSAMLIPWYTSLGDELSTLTWINQLKDIVASPFLFHGPQINRLLEQHDRNFEKATALLNRNRVRDF